VAGPGDGTGNGGQVADKRRCLSAFAVQVLDLADLIGVVVEQEGVLLLEVVPQVVTLQNAVEFAQELQ
jgi:hypothetical protein